MATPTICWCCPTSSGDVLDGREDQFVEELAFGPGAWDQLPSHVQQTFITNASTFLDEAGEPDALNLGLSKLSRLDRSTLLSQGDQSPS